MAKIRNALQKLPKKPVEEPALIEPTKIEPVKVDLVKVEPNEKSIYATTEPAITTAEIIAKIDGIKQDVKDLTIESSEIRKYVQVNSDMRHNGQNWQYKEENSINFKEITDLIQIRQYVVCAINNHTTDRPTVSEMNGTLLLLDKKILGLLKSNEFKEYIGYSGVRKVIEDTVKINSVHARKDNLF